LTSPSDQEWTSTINNLPNGKAAGPSGISYEMLKHLGKDTSALLRSLVDDCLNLGCILTE